jgi:PAS domain S-box-containing protein
MAAELLGESDERLYGFAESMPQIVWVATSEGNPVYFNQRWYDYTGLSWESSKGSWWTAPVHPDDRARFLAEWQEATQSGQAFQTELRLLSSNGQYRWFLTRAQRSQVRGDEAGSWYGTCTDIDEQKRAQDELRRSEQRFRLLAEAMPQIVWMATAQGAVVYFNPRWFEYTGLTYEQSCGEGWFQVIHPEDHKPATESWTWAVKQGGALAIEQRLRRGSDGAFRWHLVRAVPMRDENGTIVQWVGTATDIDDQKQHAELLARLVAEQTGELRRSNRELELFATVASHDLQEPLRKIQAFGDRLQARSGSALGEQGLDYLERIVGAAARMRKLINDLLSFSRISLSAKPFEAVDLSAVAAGVVSDLEELLRQSGGVIEIGALPIVDGDEPQLRQLFQNLISNALKFHPPGSAPRVTVTATRLANADAGHDDPRMGSYEIAVADNGIGFDEIYLERIFGVFQRLHGRGEFEGTGMGLAICRKIVERHQGKITARSQPGQGATFLVSLHAYPPGQDLTTNAKPAQANHDPDGR